MPTFLRSLVTAVTCAVLVILPLLAIPAHAQNLVTNGDFESGLTGWTIWEVNDPFWSHNWIFGNDCDIWVPSTCPLEGSISYSQKKGSDAPRAHGGIYQVLNVVPGDLHVISGSWSGGVTGNPEFGDNATWWEVVIYDGSVDGSVIDQAPGPQDVLIAKMERSGLIEGDVYQFDWTSFSGSFTPQSSTVTLAMKVGSYNTLEAAGYLDEVTVQARPVRPVPALPPWAFPLLVVGLFLVAYAGKRSRIQTATD